MIFCNVTVESKMKRKVRESYLCKGCGTTVVRSLNKRRQGITFYCVDCKAKSMQVRTNMQTALRKAIRLGTIQPITADTKCARCDAPAYGYEHRDYTQPLNVQPVCRKCNWHLGAAVNLRLVR